MTHNKIARTDNSRCMDVSRNGEETANDNVLLVNQDDRLWIVGRIINVPYRIFSHVKAAIAVLYIFVI